VLAWEAMFWLGYRSCLNRHEENLMTTNSFVDVIVKDPANPPKVKLVVGYLGKAASAGLVRIYTNPELSEHIDVPEGAVLHTLEVPDDHFGAQYIWIDRDAEVTVRDTSRSELKTRFMAGPLAESAADSGGNQAAAQAAFAAAPSFVQICPTPSFNPATCPTENARCPSNVGLCPSVDIACPTLVPQNCPGSTSLLCPTLTLKCPSVAICPSGICPSQVMECPPRTLADCPHLTRPQACQIFTRVQNCFQTKIGCRTFLGGCGSAVDACPSALQCGTTIFGTIFGPLM